MRSPWPPRRRKGSGALKAEIKVWNSQGGGKDKHLFFFLYIPQSSSHKRFFSLHGILQARILQWEFPSPGDLPNLGLLHFRRVLYL